MDNNNQITAPTNVSQLFPHAAAHAPALEVPNVEVQLQELLAIHKDPNAVAQAVIELTATIEDSNFPQAVLNTHVRQCLEAGADAETARAHTQSKIDADFYHVDNVARLASLVTCIRTYMTANKIQIGTLEQRIA